MLGGPTGLPAERRRLLSGSRLCAVRGPDSPRLALQFTHHLRSTRHVEQCLHEMPICQHGCDWADGLFVFQIYKETCLILRVGEKADSCDE